MPNLSHYRIISSFLSSGHLHRYGKTQVFRRIIMEPFPFTKPRLLKRTMDYFGFAKWSFQKIITARLVCSPISERDKCCSLYAIMKQAVTSLLSIVNHFKQNIQLHYKWIPQSTEPNCKWMDSTIKRTEIYRMRAWNKIWGNELIDLKHKQQYNLIGL